MEEQQSSASAGNAISGLGVLLAEDDDFTRMMLQRLLEDLGVGRVWPAADGDEALQLLDAHGGDVGAVICDLEMPGRGGLELLMALRAKEEGRTERLPVIVLTAHREAEVVQQAISFGVAGYLVKPVSKQELAQRLAVAAAQNGA
jgi:two-component system, chemotaxis family, chemotaxis protein CheY